MQAPAVARDITNQRVDLYAFYGGPYTLAFRSGTDRAGPYALVSGRGRIGLLTPRTDPYNGALSSRVQGRSEQAEDDTPSFQRNEPSRAAVAQASRETTTGLCQPLPIDLSTYRSTRDDAQRAPAQNFTCVASAGAPTVAH